MTRQTFFGVDGEGRSRPFPPKAVLGPTFTSGWEPPGQLDCQARSGASCCYGAANAGRP